MNIRSGRAVVLLSALLAVVSGCSSGVGNNCRVDEDCDTGTCYVGPGGGYCTTPCQTEGSTSECLPDTVCKPIQGGPRRCLLICGSQSACASGACEASTCPSGSSCAAVGNTDLRACEPNPG
jgi:hypothetical protein